MLKMSYAGCPGLSPAISAQFTLKMCVAARNRKQLIRNLYFGVQGHSRSPTLTPVKSLSLAIACYVKQHICAYLQPFSLYTR